MVQLEFFFGFTIFLDHAVGILDAELAGRTQVDTAFFLVFEIDQDKSPVVEGLPDMGIDVDGPAVLHDGLGKVVRQTVQVAEVVICVRESRIETERKKKLLIYLNQNKENYNKLLTSLILKNRTKTRQLEDNDIYKRLHELEVRMQSNENTIYSLQSYIDSKANENQYGNLLKECMELQQKINEELLKRYK